jgi:hypothetical protein
MRGKTSELTVVVAVGGLVLYFLPFFPSLVCPTLMQYVFPYLCKQKHGNIEGQINIFDRNKIGISSRVYL